MTEFRDGPPIEWIAQQLDLEEGTGVEPSSEDLELKFEEDQDQRDWLSDDENEGSEPEDPEYAQLRQEEQQVKASTSTGRMMIGKFYLVC